MKHNANPSILIDWFDDFDGENPFSFLSNFHEGNAFFYADYWFFTAEQAFAWEKIDHLDPLSAEFADKIIKAYDPGEAKRLGRAVPLIPNWNTYKFRVMREIVYAKFIQHEHLQDKLLDTGDAWLQQGTYWNDREWGVDITSSVNPFMREGSNMLGSILMETRAKIGAGKKVTAFGLDKEYGGISECSHSQ
jgi:ribA/ribD-fused uncharacterized protein